MLVCEANHGLSPANNRLVKTPVNFKNSSTSQVWDCFFISVFKRQLTSQTFTLIVSVYLPSNDTNVLQEH